MLTGGVAIEQAIEDSCTHILVLLTRPEGTKGKNANLYDKLIIAALRKRFPILAQNYLQGFENYRAALAKIEQLRSNNWNGLPKVETIKVPSYRPEVHRLERRPKVLIQGAVDGYNAVMASFAPYPLSVNEDVKIIR